MELIIKGTPEEIKKVLQAIASSEEQSITLDSSRILKGLHRDQSNSLRQSGVLTDRE